MTLRAKLAAAALGGMALLSGCARGPLPLTVFTTASSTENAVDFIKKSGRDGLYMMFDTNTGAGQFLAFDSAKRECTQCGRYTNYEDMPERLARTDVNLQVLNEAGRQLVLDTKRLSPGGAGVVVVQLYDGDPAINDYRYGDRTLIFSSSAADVTCTFNSLPKQPGPYDAACVPSDTLTPSAKALVGDRIDQLLPFRPGITAPAAK
jgi:hypothetical protein